MTSQRPILRLVALVELSLCWLAASRLAQDCPELLGQWPDDAASLVAVEEPYAYVGHQSILTVADISDPMAPRAVGSLALDYVGGLAAADGYVFVGGGDFIVVDATNPEQPHVEATVSMPWLWLEEIAVAGRSAWVACWDAVLRVMDLRDPESPVEVGVCDPPEMNSFAGVGSDYAVAVADGSGLLVFDTCELPVLADGFESGDTSAWSGTVP